MHSLEATIGSITGVEEASLSRYQSVQLGWLPALSVINAVALLLTAFAYSASRNNAPWGEPAFWVSLLLIFLPTVYRIMVPTISQHERFGIIILAGISLYLVKVLQSPTVFNFHDEFLHWRTASDILQRGQLFATNNILPISPRYPGLEVITTSLAAVSGLSIFQAGMIVIGIGRVILSVAICFFFQKASRSMQIGGLAALLYMANSNFLFFGSQFSYESLSIPIAMTLLCVIASKERTQYRLGLIALTSMLALTVVATHHLTAFVLCGFLFLWMIIAFFERRGRQWQNIGIVAVTTLVITLAWATTVGNVTTSYLLPVFRSGFTEFAQLLGNENTGRQLFQSASGQVSPTWERITAILSVVFVLLILPWGVLNVLISPFRKTNTSRGMKVLRANLLQAWQQYGNNPLAYTLAFIVFIHPLMLALRFTSSGWEIANRSSEFVFWGVAFILAASIFDLRNLRVSKQVWKLGFLVWIGVVFAGGAISGWPPWARLPGPYLVSADARSIEPIGISAAQWANTHLDSSNHMGADRINTLLMATYGQQYMVTHLESGVYIAQVVLAPKVGSEELKALKRAKIRYLVVDERISTDLPHVGVYFEVGEPNGNKYTTPPTLAALQKFGALLDVDQLFDNGSIKIYDISRLVTP